MKKQYDHKIDEMFGGAFKDFEAEPPKHIWDNVKAQIPRSANLVNPKKSFLHYRSTYFILSASVAVVLLTAIYLYISPDSPVNAGYAASLFSKDSSVISSVKEKPVVNNNVIHINPDVTPKNNYTYALTAEKTKTDNVSQHSLNNKPAKVAGANENSNKNTRFAATAKSYKPGVNTKNALPAGDLSKSDSGSGLAESENQFVNKNDFSLTAKISETTEKTTVTNYYDENLSKIKILKTEKISVAEPGKTIININPFEGAKPSVQHSRAGIYFGLHYNPEWIFNLPGNNSPVNLPDENNFSQSVQISLNYDLRNFTFQSGLGYSFYNNNTSAGINFKSFDSVGYYNDVLYFSYDSINDITVLYTTPVNVYDSVSHFSIKPTRNKYRYFLIPFITEYKYYSRRFYFSGFIGAGLGILTFKNEPEINFDISNAGLINTVKYSPSVTKTYWQITGGIGCGYFITDNISFAAEPSFRYYLKSFYSETSGKKPYSVGVKAGVYVRF